jgi:hypothetical protein
MGQNPSLEGRFRYGIGQSRSSDVDAEDSMIMGSGQGSQIFGAKASTGTECRDRLWHKLGTGHCGCAPEARIGPGARRCAVLRKTE